LAKDFSPSWGDSQGSVKTFNVVHMALTPLAGSPVRIVKALNRYTAIRARLVVLNPNAYGRRKFDGDVDGSHDTEKTLQLLRDAEIVHLHHFFDLQNNPFGIDFKTMCSRARLVRQFHTHPLTIARGDKRLARRIVDSEIPQLVIAQYHERFYPRARIVPNIVPLMDDLYRPVSRSDREPRLFFAPTFSHSAWEIPKGGTRWETKGSPETEALLRKVLRRTGVGKVVIPDNCSHDQCLREKQTSNIAIDEMVTGSFHLSSLESLAQGIPTFAYLDGRTLDTLAEMTGSHRHPWLNFRLEEAEEPLIALISDAKLRSDLGEASRKWMESYYNDRELVNHYVRAYEDLVERPEIFERQRFDPDGRGEVFLAQRRDDLIWHSRVSRLVIGQNKPVEDVQSVACMDKISSCYIPKWVKGPIHELLKKYTSVRVEEIQALRIRLQNTEKLLEFIAADEINRWLYHNRLERMDATLDVFDRKRREFHLDRYRFATRRVNGKRVLDCACGTGYGLRILREIGTASFVLGVDLDCKAIQYACKNHKTESTAFLCASGDCLAIADASVDVVTSFETIEHVPDDVGLIKEFRRVLKPAGILIISTPNNWPLAAAPFHVREYDRKSFIGILNTEFDCVELYNQNSGSDTPFNHDQLPGIVPTTPQNEELAECYLAVCKPK
jgi:SAM-dependent methyltransferase